MVLELVGRVKEFDEDLHPRDEHGRFAGGESGGSEDRAVAQAASGIPPLGKNETYRAPGSIVDDPILKERLAEAMAVLGARPDGANERMIGMAPSGDVHIDRIGNETSVSMRMDELHRLADGVIAHSHPIDMGPSSADLLVAINGNLRAVVTVHEDHAWVIEREGARWGEEDDFGGQGPLATFTASWSAMEGEAKEWGAQHGITDLNELQKLTGGNSPASNDLNRFCTDQYMARIDADPTMRAYKVNVTPGESETFKFESHGGATKESGIVTIPLYGPLTPAKEVEHLLETLKKQLAGGSPAAKAWRWLVGRKYSPDQERDERGRFGGDGGSISPGAAGRQLHDLKSKGGFTYSTLSRFTPRVGKVLSIHPERTQEIAGRKATMEDLDAYIAANKDLLGDKQNYVGGWRDRTDGTTYLDVSAIVSTHAEAVALGQEHNQLAYYDLETKSEVRLDGKGSTDGSRRPPSGRDTGRKAAFPRLPQWRWGVRSHSDEDAGRRAVERLQRQARLRSIVYDQKLWDELRAHATSAAMPVFAELYMGGVEAALRLARHRGHKEREYVRDDAGRFAETEGDAGGTVEHVERLSSGSGRVQEVTLYHGTHGDFDPAALDVQDPEYDGGLGPGIYLGEDRATAEYFGSNVIEATVRVENPLVFDIADASDGGGNVRIAPEIADQYNETGDFDSILTGERVPPFDVKIADDWYEVRSAFDLEHLGPEAQAAGHDAVVARNLREGSSAGASEVLIFDKKNIVGTKEQRHKDEGPTSLDQQIAQRALIDRVRLVNEWWSNIENSARKQLDTLLASAATPEGALDVGAVIEGVSALFGPERAERIAVTETTRVMGQAAIATYELLGVDEWEWRTAEDGRVCPECEDMRDGGPYLVTDVFEPSHPRCRCWAVPVPAGMKEFAEKEAGHAGAMVALFPSAALAKKLALPGGEPAADLHVTLAFLGKAADIDGKAVIAAVTRAVQEYGPMKGEVSGVGRFSIPDGDAFYASVDLPGGNAFQQALVEALDAAGIPAASNHGWTAHMTLAYIEADEEIPLDRMEPVPVTFDSVVVALGDERTHIMFGAKEFDEDQHPRDEHGRFAGLDEHEAESHRAMGRWGSHEARPLDKLHHGRDPKLTHKHTKFGALITSNNNIVGSPLASLVGRRDWNEDDHPRDEHGRFANSDSGYLGGTMDESVGYDGPPPGSHAALEAAAKEYPWLKDPTKVPTVSEFPGAKTVVDTPEIIAERLLAPQQSIDITQEQAERRAAELKAEQDDGVKQEREAHIILGIPASAKSKLVANPLAAEIGARLADADIAKEIVAQDLGYTQGREEGADGYAGIVHEASSTITRHYIEDSIARGDNLVIPKVGDNYDKMASQIQTLKDNGYTVKVTFVDVSPEEGMRRNAARYYTTGRFVDPLNTLERTDSKPEATYERLKADGLADGFKRIDNNGGPGEHFVVEDIGSVGAKAEGGAPQAPLAGLFSGGAPGRDDVRRLNLVGRKYSDDQERDDQGRWTAGAGDETVTHLGGLEVRRAADGSFYQVAADGEPVQVSAEIEGMKSFAVMVDAMKAAEAIGYRQTPDMAKETEFGKFASSLPGAQDPALALMAKEKGFDAPPKLVSSEEIDKLIAAGAPDLWRGVAGFNRQDQPRFTGEEAAEGLLKGDYYAGKGTYGDGIYFISSTDTDTNKSFPAESARIGAAVNFAGGYAGSDGAVVHATLPPDAKIADYNMIHAEASSLYNSAAYEQGDEDSHEAATRHVLYDDGRYAMAKGYDAIKVPPSETGTSPFYVILNRSALVAEDKAYPVKVSSDYVITAPELRDRVRWRPEEE